MTGIELEPFTRPRTRLNVARPRPVLDLFEDLSRPLAIDLFCGQGGAGMGYHRAGFRVIGVDIIDQPRYPFRFIKADALSFARRGWPDVALWHASPPCQAVSTARHIRGDAYVHPNYIRSVRAALINTGQPYVIENVGGAPLLDPIRLCGAMFRLRTYRHRLFESNVELIAPPHSTHFAPTAKLGRPPQAHEFLDPVGHFSDKEAGRLALGCEWMTGAGLSQAIPPSYTMHVGSQVMAHLDGDTPHRYATRRDLDQATTAIAMQQSPDGTPATDPLTLYA